MRVTLIGGIVIVYKIVAHRRRRQLSWEHITHTQRRVTVQPPHI